MVFLLLLIQSLTSGISNMLLIINVTDDFSELNQHLITLYRRLNGNLMPLMQAVAGTLEDSTKQRFNSKVAPNGVHWQNLKPSTLQTKQRRGGGILVDSGDLLTSITSYANNHSVVVGSNEVYAKYHQVGTNKMPARPFLGLSEQDKARLRERLNEFLEDITHG